MLAERGHAMREALARLAGRSEWGVKALAEPRPPAAPFPEQAGGAGYLLRKQQERRSREQSEAAVQGAVRECHERLEREAVAAQMLPAQSREVAGYSGEMVFNAAYLVDDDRAEAFRRAVGELDRPGLTVELTGPWPAFHFAEERAA